jgi:hypothetical protein
LSITVARWTACNWAWLKSSVSVMASFKACVAASENCMSVLAMMCDRPVVYLAARGPFLGRAAVDSKMP